MREDIVIFFRFVRPSAWSCSSLLLHLLIYFSLLFFIFNILCISDFIFEYVMINVENVKTLDFQNALFPELYFFTQTAFSDIYE